MRTQLDRLPHPAYPAWDPPELRRSFDGVFESRPSVLELRKATLESHVYRVKIASSSYSAIQILAEMPIAAVLLEYSQEGMDAEAVAFHLKQRFPDQPEPG
jgi:CheY-like chemotaxis protein